MRTNSHTTIAIAAALAAFCLAGPAAAETPQEVVDNATRAVQDMGADPSMTWFRENVHKARAVVIVPTYVKGGFIFGAAGGNGVVMTRGGRSWSHPSFVSLASLSAGLQAGAQGGQLVLLVMTDRGRDAILSDKFQIGTDASIAAGPVGVGAQAATSDIVAYSRSAGVFGGLTVEGGTLAKRDGWNEDYYGKGVRPLDILENRTKTNRGARELRVAMASVGGR